MIRSYRSAIACAFSLLVCSKEQDQRVKEVLDFLAKSGRLKPL